MELVFMALCGIRMYDAEDIKAGDLILITNINSYEVDFFFYTGKIVGYGYFDSPIHSEHLEFIGVL